MAAIFWTWVWGPMGLVMSTPLTVCLVVLGRHVPQFEIFAVLFGDRPVLAPEARLYQRFLAGDAIESTFRAEEALEEVWLADYYRDVALPALMQFLLGLAIFLLAVGITIFAANSLGVDNFLGIILVFIVSFIVIAILFALATLVLYCLPGLIAASGIYAATDSQGAAIAAFIIVTIITVVLVYIFKEYIMPFIFGFGLNWVALGLANQIALAIVLGASLASALPGRGDYLDPYA